MGSNLLGFGASGLGPGFLFLNSRTVSGLGVVGGASGNDAALPRPSCQRAEPRYGTLGRPGGCFGDWWAWLSDPTRLALEAQLATELLVASSVSRSNGDGDLWSMLLVEGLPRRLRSLSPMAAQTDG